MARSDARPGRRRSGGRSRAGDEGPPGRGTGLPDDGKLYYRIGEVSRITGVKPYVLRYWESEFRWMAPQKSRSRQRLYRRKDIETILLVKKLLYEERYTIAGARQRLRELAAGQRMEELAKAGATDPREELRRIRDELAELRALLSEPA